MATIEAKIGDMVVFDYPVSGKTPNENPNRIGTVENINDSIIVLAFDEVQAEEQGSKFKAFKLEKISEFNVLPVE